MARLSRIVPSLLQAYARAQSDGLRMYSDNVIPMHQYNQRMARDEEERASMENWRQQQLAIQRENAERQAGADQMGAYYGMMKEYLKNQQPTTPDYPTNYEAAHIRALESGNQSLADYYGGRVMERNSYQDRPVKEVAPKMPTNYVQKFTNRMADLQNNYDWRNTQGYTPNPTPVGEKVWRGEFEGQAMSEGLDTDSIRTLVGLPPATKQDNVGAYQGFGQIGTPTMGSGNITPEQARAELERRRKLRQGR